MAIIKTPVIKKADFWAVLGSFWANRKAMRRNARDCVDLMTKGQQCLCNFCIAALP